MEFLDWISSVFFSAIDVVVHLDDHLKVWMATMGSWSYLIVAIIIFAESGIVLTPFLPGDSLLFALGALAGMGSLDLKILLLSLMTAAISGGVFNYFAGQWLGHKVYGMGDRFFFRQAHLKKTHNFYETHGGKTVFIARFIPIVRTFAPFIAGVAGMPFKRFFTFNLVGGVFWVLIMVQLGFYFGNLPFVKDHFGMVVPAIIVISVIPIFWSKISSLFTRRRSLPKKRHSRPQK